MSTIMERCTRGNEGRRPRLGIALVLAATAIIAGCASSATVSPPPPLGPDGKLVAAGSAEPVDTDAPGWGITDAPPEQYSQVVHHVVGMVDDQNTQSAVQRRGLGLLNVMWEDTGRSLGSSVGPNISDLTLEVRYRENGQNRADLLPVIRFPNFEDRTGDIPSDRFLVRVGNQKNGGKLESVPLTDVLKNLKNFVSDPSSIKGSGNFSAARDSHFLVSAQAVFLPIPKEGHAEFTPVIFNYQSMADSPAVMTLLVRRQGMSASVVTNEADSMSPTGRGQELYFNEHGQRAPFTAERRSDVVARVEGKGGAKTEDDKTAIAKGADVLFLIQIPLKHRSPPRNLPMGMEEDSAGPMPPPMAAPAPPSAMGGAAAKPKKSDVETAVLGHGKAEGKFEEGRNLAFERDPQFPVRITVQFYKATSNGVVAEKDLDGISAAIGNVYEHADFVGSLVIPGDDPRRPTAWQTTPPNWFAF
jgi:hypothetical protein